MYYSKDYGVYFVEGIPAGTTFLHDISTVLDGYFSFSNVQLKSLDDVKREMAKEVLAKGGNAVVNFKYGQKTGSFWECLFSHDNVRWTGQGKIAIIDPSVLEN